MRFLLSLLVNITRWLKTQVCKIKPAEHAINGASALLVGTAFVLFIFFAISISFSVNDPWVLLFFFVIAIVTVLSAYLFVWLLGKINTIPKRLKLALLIASPLLLFALAFEGLYWIAVVLLTVLLGGAVNVLIVYEIKSIPAPKRVAVFCSLLLSIGGIVAASLVYFPGGFDSKPIINAAALNANEVQNIAGDSPAKKGPYQVEHINYGSGEDKHRDEFGEDVDLKTETVNGVAFLDNWQGFSGWYRENYWGFDDKSLPLNAYVWYPQGEGPFPLVLMVHGNHSMQDYSDDGYAYLGEMLASRGFIFASVDQNFINASWSDIFGGLDEENDARGWLLLEHLKVWHAWNADEESRFYNKIDIQNLALIGHSRGGEAVAHAALLNTMPAFYDDATVPMDYNFDIKSIVAIAPVDGQYKPGEARTELTDINYFVMHGAQDADVTSYVGVKQYQRIEFSQDDESFKAGVYIAGANHGQFNTGWGDNDTGGFAPTKFLNNKPLLPAAEQQQIAQVYISAFLETTLNNKHEYLPLFVDHRRGKDWLPETLMLNQFENASFTPLVDFNADFDVSTSSVDDGVISTQNLTVWREQEVETKYGNKGTRAVVIAWHSEEDEDAPNDATVTEANIGEHNASFTITLPDSLPSPSVLSEETSMLVFSIAASDEKTNPKASGKWVNNKNTNAQTEDHKDSNNKDLVNENLDKGDSAKIDEPAQAIDFTITLEDAMGNQVSFPLSQFSALQRPIETQVWKSAFIFDSTESEMVFQTFSYPISALTQTTPEFDISQLKRLNIIFDKSKEGVIWLESMGFMRL